jgi:hypothetical protein
MTGRTEDPRQVQNPDSVTCLLIGDTGTGKSSFANLYLQADKATVGEDIDPVTLKPESHSNLVNGVNRTVIDTEGFDTGRELSEGQFQRCAVCLKDHTGGTKGVCVVLNASNVRYTSGVNDLLLWLYKIFGTLELLGQIALVFTRSTGSSGQVRERGNIVNASIVLLAQPCALIQDVDLYQRRTLSTETNEVLSLIRQNCFDCK